MSYGESGLTRSNFADEDGSKLHHKNVYGIDKPFSNEEKRKDGNYEMSWCGSSPRVVKHAMCFAPTQALSLTEGAAQAEASESALLHGNIGLWNRGLRPLGADRVFDAQVHEQGGEPQRR